MTFDDSKELEIKNAYDDKLLDRSDLLARILIAGEEYSEGRTSRLQYYDEIRDILNNKGLN